MKSDEEFIAGIYRKAEERKVEEVKDDAGKKPHFRAWSALAAAASCPGQCMLGADKSKRTMIPQEKMQ